MKTFLITGAGTGIGAATARKLAAGGHRLILMGRRLEKLDEVKETLAGDQHETVSVDVSDKKKLHEAMNSGLLDGHDLNGVFANAGIGGSNEYGEGDRWEQIINVNLSGAYYTVMEAIPFLKKSSSSYRNVVITSSCLARFGVPYYTAYCASKSGITGLVRALSMEYASSGLLVNAILPGWVDTEMARKGIQLIADDSNIEFEQTLKEQMSFVPLKKMSEPEEIASLVEFLFANKQTSITGQCLDINNGSFMI